MSTAFASSQARLGASLSRRLANAAATVLPGSATVDGIFSRRAVDSQLGGTGFVTQVVDMVVPISDADAHSISEGKRLAIDGETWEVALRTDDVELGQARLDLKLPPG